ncbi:hypothetical protein CTA2_7392 [Colletotrichum tanaceti]|uniref:Heme haloperoxidase family profile domain-containing protein n=1 Tax=Colletotrichum tanaceti TaxID=1306861 RepID=A0A4U6X215_9PEZI|nr:hypothetical protein CTA2_7392 [Colletotrichum tanaceti]TKW49185.1 hypothetical protein CTA1_5104 [Colletotrichum tanaceti]
MRQFVTVVALGVGLVSADPLSAKSQMSNPHIRRGSLDEWENVLKGLREGLNLEDSLGELMFKMAIPVSPEPNATFFTQDQPDFHNVLELDASLSHTDTFFGSNHNFNQTIFDESRPTEPRTFSTRTSWSTARMPARSNPVPLIRTTPSPQLSRTSAWARLPPRIIAFGNMTAGTLNKILVEYFFYKSSRLSHSSWRTPFLSHRDTVEERLPAELGWIKKEKAIIPQEDILGIVGSTIKAASLVTGS